MSRRSMYLQKKEKLLFLLCAFSCHLLHPFLHHSCTTCKIQNIKNKLVQLHPANSQQKKPFHNLILYYLHIKQKIVQFTPFHYSILIPLPCTFVLHPCPSKLHLQVYPNSSST